MVVRGVNTVASECTLLIGKKPLPPSTRHIVRNERSWIRRCWRIHYLLAIVVLSIGMFRNFKPVRKYLKIKPSQVAVPVLNQPCTAAYLNVLAASSNEPDAIIYCTTKNRNSNQSAEDAKVCTSLMKYSQMLLQYARDLINQQSNICTDKSQKFPFVGRLTKFPDAWLLPLFPLLFRLVYCLIVNLLRFLLENVTCPRSDANSVSSIPFIFRRLCFYFILMNFRGWVLYILLNKIEDQFVEGSNSTHNTCWYNVEGWLSHRSEQEKCAGRPFDFSDHIVLYYAQILPISLFETLYITIEHPHWYARITTEQSIQNKHYLMSMRYTTMNVMRWLVPMVLLGTHIYLQIITTFGSFKTTIYFHTPFEIISGFIISLTISVPLYYIQCSNANHRMISHLRTLLFGS